VGKLLETAALRGQIARFLHKHKNEAGCVKLPLKDMGSDARSGAAALSRRDNEGGAVRDRMRRGTPLTPSRNKQEGGLN